MAKRAPGELTRTDEVMARVIESLYALGGGAEINHIRKRYLELNKDWLRPEDFEDTQGKNDIRWSKEMDWALQPLKREGVVLNSGYGYWELTESWRRGENPSEKYRELKYLDRAKKSIQHLSRKQKEELMNTLKAMSPDAPSK